jgi:hypothetical protein
MSDLAIALAGAASLFFSFVYYRMERNSRLLNSKKE